MKKIALVLIASSFVLFGNCKSKEKTQKTATDTPQAVAGEVKVKYRLVISFTSHAGGIDASKYDAIESFVKAHAKKPAFDLLKAGREGEREICMELKELSKTEQTAFVDEIKKLAQGSERVIVAENIERVKKQ